MARRADFYMRQNDTAPEIRSVLKTRDDDGELVVENLTGASVKIIIDGKDTGIELVNANATVLDAEGGEVVYYWQNGDVDTAGWFNVEWQITYPDATKRTFPNPGYLLLKVDAELGS